MTAGRRVRLGVAALSLAVTASACGSSSHPATTGVPAVVTPGGKGSAGLLVAAHADAPPAIDATDLARVERGQDAFALGLLRTSMTGSGNTLVSPLSAAIAMAMLQLGAGRSTETGIAKALASTGVPAAVEAGATRELLASLLHGEERATLHVATSAWLQQGFPVRPAFLDTLAGTFGNTAYETDFAKHPAQSAAAINAWVAHGTDGQITRLFTPADLDDAVFVLADALYFEARWAVPMTDQRQEFHVDGGKATSVRGVYESQVTMPYLHAEGVTAVGVPYQAGRYQALVIEPDRGSLASFVDGLTPTRFSAITSAMRSGLVDLSMPALTLTADQGLNGALSSLGMGAAFSPSADFAPISPVSTQLSLVEQADLLEVTDAGTVAAAATGAVGVSTSANAGPTDVVDVDRPYLFVLRDRTTGAVLMAATIEDPARA